MTNKYAGVCSCGARVPARAGSLIGSRGRWQVQCQVCAGPETVAERKPVAPCWICGAADGYFRARGAATPVWCDTCNEKQSKGDLRLGTATVLNAKLFVPDRFDMDYEDSCRDRCGL